MAIYVFPAIPENSLPGVSVTVNTSAFTGTSGNSSKPLMLIGESEDGAPQTVAKYTSYSDAKSALRSGDLLDAMELAWNPTSTDDYYAGDILAIRSQPATQATLTEGTLTFTSKLYSENANDILISLQKNDVTDTYRLNISYPEDGVSNSYDSLGKIMSIAYNGTYAYAGYSITTDANSYASELDLYTGNTESSATLAQSFKLGDSSQYPKTNNLINAINSVDGFTASRYDVGDKNIYTKYFYETEQTAVPATTNTLYLNALEGDIMHTVGDYDDYVSITYTPQGTPIDPSGLAVTPIADGFHIQVDNIETVQPLAAFNATNLSGAKVGVSPDSWSDLFEQFSDAVDSTAGYYLVPLTDDAAIHAEASAFVNEQSEYDNAMRTIVGSGLSEGKQQLISRALDLDDGRTYLVGQSAMVRMSDGTTQDMPGYMMAAMIAGIASGVDVGDSITYKTIDVVSLDGSFTRDDLNELNGEGVIMIANVRNRSTSNFKIVDDLSTSSDTDDPIESEMAVAESSDFFIAGLRERIADEFIGTKISTSYAQTITAYAQGYCSDMKSEGIILDYDSSSISTEIVGSVASVSGTVYPDRTLKRVNFTLAYDSETISSTSTITAS